MHVVQITNCIVYRIASEPYELKNQNSITYIISSEHLWAEKSILKGWQEIELYTSSINPVEKIP